MPSGGKYASIARLLFGRDRLLLVEIAYQVIFLALAHLEILQVEDVVPDAPRLAARAPAIFCVPKARLLFLRVL
jgi:hypothetical protein